MTTEEFFKKYPRAGGCWNCAGKAHIGKQPPMMGATWVPRPTVKEAEAPKPVAKAATKTDKDAD